MSESPVRPVAPVVALLALLAGCTIPVDWFGRRPALAPTPKPTVWERNTIEGAKAFQEGRLSDAERSLERARENSTTGAGTDLERAASLVNLALVKQAQGDIAGALVLQQEALGLREKAL